MKASQDRTVVQYRTFESFYPFYLTEHDQPVNRILHFIGTSLAIVISLCVVLSRQWKLLYLVPLCGYGFAWIGHFFFQKNKPAAWKYPIYSLRGDLTMWLDIILQRQSIAPSVKKLY